MAMRYLMLPCVAIQLAWLQVHSAPPSADAREHHEAGVAYHLTRSLDEASEEYDRTLTIEPPQEPDSPQRARMLALIPRIFVNRAEPFALRDAAAIHHPRLRLIAYHLFWEDDVDFPDDNEPSDHEVVWVEYDARGALVAVTTLFHGRPIVGGGAALQDAAAHGGRPRIDVQWGKHGSMPAGWQSLRLRTEESDEDTGIPADRDLTLLEYNQLTWQKLASVGTRGRAHPLAIRYGWPDKFAGNEAAFLSMTREVDARPLLQKRSMMLVSEWNSATLARRLILYNFKPKMEWP